MKSVENRSLIACVSARVGAKSARSRFRLVEAVGGLALLMLLAGAGVPANAQTGDWTWVGGSSVVNQAGTYGTLGTGTVGNTPGSRFGPTAAKDASGNIWLFGGLGNGDQQSGVSAEGDLDDLWEFNQSQEWVWMSGSNNPCGEECAVYGTLGVPASGNLPPSRYFANSWIDGTGNFWLFGGQSYGKEVADYLNDVWEFNPSTKEWAWVGGSSNPNQPSAYGTLGVAAAGNVPGARGYAFNWTDNNGNFWLFGGYEYDSASTRGYLNDVWEFNPSSNEWTWIGGSTGVNQAGVYGTLGVPSTANFPGSRYWGANWTDTSGNLWLFGGYGYDSTGTTGLLNDLWRFDPSTKEWTWVTGSKTVTVDVGSAVVPGLENPFGWADNTGNFWLFGGLANEAGGKTSDLVNALWEFSNTTQEWTLISGSDTAQEAGNYGSLGVPSASNDPGARQWDTGWTDSRGNLWLFGGQGQDSANNWGQLNDLWEFETVPTTATPVFSVAGGTYPPSPSVTITDATPNSTIYYTTDGTTPTTNSAVYSGAITVPSTETLLAIATASGLAQSNVAGAVYTIQTPQTVTFAPINGTQYAASTITVSATASSGLPVTLASLTSNVCSLSGNTATLNIPGNCIITASQAGNATYSPAETTLSFTVTIAPQTINFPAIGKQTAGVNLQLVATASSGLPVTFASTKPAVCTVSGSTASFIAAGTCSIDVTQNGNNVYAKATPVGTSFIVVLASQTITFPMIANQIVGANVTLAATASSGLTVGFTSATPSVCSVSGTAASMLEAGTCTIDATQAGNSTYAAAPTTPRSFLVKNTQTITFAPIKSQTEGTTLALTATASSGLPVTYTSTTPAVCTVSGSTASFIAAGTCSIDFTQNGNSTYAQATPVGTSFVVKETQTITYTPIKTQTVGTTLALSATASSGLPVTFTSTKQTVCTVSGSTASFIAAGTCSIDFTQNGNSTYAQATPVGTSFVVAE
jgi:Chitobiase/beta-hexosaminidase C-terminal domain/Galactose oxidase, central domain